LHSINQSTANQSAANQSSNYRIAVRLAFSVCGLRHERRQRQLGGVLAEGQEGFVAICYSSASAISWFRPGRTNVEGAQHG